jgi:hypothetical protein
MEVFALDNNKIYNKIIDNAKSRSLIGYKERHHIMPRCIGGLDDDQNLVDLTAREHFICHLLLAKIHNHHGLWSAAWLMSNKKTVGSRQYEWLKHRFSEEHSNFMRGKNFNTPESIKKGIETRRANGTLNKSEETRRKISKATMGRIVPTTEEKRLKNSIASKDRKWVNNGIDSTMVKGEQLEALLSEGWMLGRLRTPTLIEGTKKGGKTTGGYNKGIPMSEDQREKCKDRFFKKGHIPKNKGIPMSAETREKLKDNFFKKGHSSPRKGIPMSDEQREKCKGNFFEKGHVPHNKKK